MTNEQNNELRDLIKWYAENSISVKRENQNK